MSSYGLLVGRAAKRRKNAAQGVRLGMLEREKPRRGEGKLIGSHTGTAASYLKQFTRKQKPSDRQAKLWVYGRNVTPRSSTSNREGRENGYFAVTLSDGQVDESVETILAGFDDKAATLLRLFAHETYVLSPKDKEAFTECLALIFARTTARRELTGKIARHIRDAYAELSSDPEWLQEQAKINEELSGKPTTLKEASRSVARVLTRISTPEYVRNSFIQGLFHLASGVYEELSGKSWQVWEAPERSEFVTTDNPIITLKPDTWGRFFPGWGLRSEGLKIAFPLSPIHCLLIGADGRHWRRVTPNDVNLINKALVLCMDRWTYSASYSEDIRVLVDSIGGTVRYGEQAFVPVWMNEAPTYFRARVRDMTSIEKIKPQLVPMHKANSA